MGNSIAREDTLNTLPPTTPNTATAEFVASIESILHDAGFCALLVRKANTAGGYEVFVLRNATDIDAARTYFRPADIVHVLSSAAFPVKGKACYDLVPEAIRYVEQLIDAEEAESADALRLDSDSVCLEGAEYSGLGNASQVESWFKNHEGHMVALGNMEICFEYDIERINSPDFKMASFYVPCPDGTFRSGSY